MTLFFIILLSCIIVGVTISTYMVRGIDALALRHQNRERRKSVKRNKVALKK